MSINDLMVLRGRVASDVTLHRAKESGGKSFGRFRMVVPRVRRKDNGEWEEGEPSWYTVRAWGALAENLNFSFRKGQPVLVTGRPAAQSWISSTGEIRTELAVNATSAGHDLVFGLASYSKLQKLANGVDDPLSESELADDSDLVDDKEIMLDGSVPSPEDLIGEELETDDVVSHEDTEVENSGAA